MDHYCMCVNERHDSLCVFVQDTAALIGQYKSGAAPPADVEFEDYSQSVKTTGNENTPQLHKARIKLLFHKKSKVHTF